MVSFTSFFLFNDKNKMKNYVCSKSPIQRKLPKSIKTTLFRYI